MEPKNMAAGTGKPHDFDKVAWMGSRFTALETDTEVAIAPTLANAVLSSAFQPVFSLSHGRLVGHEALLRVRDPIRGTSVPPNEFFASLASAEERALADLRSLKAHLAAYETQGKSKASEWLFLNLHPISLLRQGYQLSALVSAIEASGVRPEKIVIEVLESSSGMAIALDHGVTVLRELGCLIAIDDFGAGHSNFERVFQLCPEIVKLDRHVLIRAEQDVRSRRIVQRMVSLLHECGALVLMEGIETLEGAHIALTCDVDLVQGYFFARPAPATLSAADQCTSLDLAWQTFDVSRSREDDKWRDAMAVQSEALQRASARLVAGRSLVDACAEFLATPGASMCFLLNENGQQIGDSVFAERYREGGLGTSPRFDPLHQCVGARWSRRPYFRRAISFMNAVQLTRPYLTLQGGQMCSTASIAFEQNGQVLILCGDLAVSEKGVLL